ncbi:MAG: hypothetical protein R3F04_05375 [Lysobacteraceae bacterium]
MKRWLLTLLALCSLPAFATGPAQPPTADEQVMAAFWARMESSADPRMQALAMVAPFEAMGGPADLPARIDRWEAGEPDADAVVLLAALSCGHAAASRLRALCDRRDLLRRWKQADASNAWPWLIEAHRAQQVEDAAALQAALEGIGRSQRIEDGYRIALATLREALASDSGFTTMAPAQRAVTTFGIALAIAVPALQGVTDLCPPTPTEQAQIAERAAICQHLGRLLFDTPQTSMLQAQLGAQVARDYAEDDAARAQANEQLAALRSLGSALAADPLLSPGGDDPKATPEGLDQYLQWVIAEGEVAAMLGWLKRGRAGA